VVTETSTSGGIARRIAYVALSTLIIVFDQVSKAAVTDRIPLHSSITVLPGLFDLTHVKNSGAAFGLFASVESPIRGILLNGVAFVVFLLVLLYALRSSARSTRLQTGLALILGGAVGNLIDRLRFGSVTDFLEVYIGTHHWPTFNVADSAITVGVCLLAWDIWRQPSEQSSERPAPA
jgi:signal peptidase II